MLNNSYDILSITSTYIENFMNGTANAKNYVDDIFKARDNNFKYKAAIIFENLEQIREQKEDSKKLKEQKIESLSERLYKLLSEN